MYKKIRTVYPNEIEILSGKNREPRLRDEFYSPTIYSIKAIAQLISSSTPQRELVQYFLEENCRAIMINVTIVKSMM